MIINSVKTIKWPPKQTLMPVALWPAQCNPWISVSPHPALTLDYARKSCHRDTSLWAANHPCHAVRSFVTEIGQHWALHLAVAGTQIGGVLAEFCRNIQYGYTKKQAVSHAGAVGSTPVMSYEAEGPFRRATEIEQVPKLAIWVRLETL